MNLALGGFDVLEEQWQDVNQWFSKWIQQLPDQQKQLTLEAIDQVVHYLSNFSHQKKRCLEMEQDILMEARIFNEDIEHIEDLSHLSTRQLEYISQKYVNKYQMYALVEGGVAGIGHPLGIALDFPALLMLNIRMVHYIASSFGYSIQHINEQMTAMHVLFGASLYENYRETIFEGLLEQTRAADDNPYLMLENEAMIPQEWLETLAKQWLKAITLYGLKKSSKKGYSIFGMALGARLNYVFTKQVAQFATKFYLERRLSSMEEIENEA